MLMDPMGGIVMTNDGNAILREVGIISCLFVCSYRLPILLDGTEHVLILQCNTKNTIFYIKIIAKLLT